MTNKELQEILSDYKDELVVQLTVSKEFDELTLHIYQEIGEIEGGKKNLYIGGKSND